MFGTSSVGQGGGLFGQNTGLFGNNDSKLFGAQSAPSNSLFGGNQTTGLFGTNTSPQNQSLFGAQAPSNSTSLFASTPQQHGAGGGGTGLFGNTAQTNTLGGAGGGAAGLFGNAGQTATNTGGSTGLFGNSGQATASGGAGGGGLFGNTGQATAGGGGGLFGNTGQTTAGGAGGLFGNAGQTTAGGGGGLFGNTGQTTAGGGGGLFGNAGQTPAGGGGGLFGNAGQSAAGGSGLFGNTGQPSAGLFGSSTQQSGTTGLGQSGGLFGQSASSNVGNPSTSLFGGGNQSGGLFGNTTSAPTQSLFGNQAPATAGNSLFSSTPQQQQLGGVNAQQSINSGLFGQSNAGSGGLFGSQNMATPVRKVGGGGSEVLLGRSKPGDSEQVVLTTRPIVRDIARLHPELANLIQGLHEWFTDNDGTLAQIKEQFADVSRISDGAFSSTSFKASDANLMAEQLEQAEELLEYTEPSVARLVKITEALWGDFQRLDSGLVAVPPVENAMLIQEFEEKKELLEGTMAAIKHVLERAEANETEEEKVNRFRISLKHEEEWIERLNSLSTYIESAFKNNL